MRASVVLFILLILGIVESKIQFAIAPLIPTSLNWISASYSREIAPREHETTRGHSISPSSRRFLASAAGNN
jgi:hypothetical protein